MVINDGRFKKGHKINQKYDNTAQLSPQAAFYRRNREKVLAWCKKYNQRIRLETLQHYSGDIPKCNCCNETHLEFLSIDHINGGGSAHRRSMNKDGKKGGNIYLWLKNNKYPKDFQVLCHNCNQAKGFYGQCPHNKVY